MWKLITIICSFISFFVNRKVACEKGVSLRAVHSSSCDVSDEDEERKSQQSSKQQPLEDCQPKQYDSMKQELLLKGKLLLWYLY